MSSYGNDREDMNGPKMHGASNRLTDNNTYRSDDVRQSEQYIPSREEKKMEDNIIDEEVYQSMDDNQRDYVASKVLQVLVTKPKGRCALGELKSELGTKIKFVSSELFLEFLQSFTHNNIFEVIKPDDENDISNENNTMEIRELNNSNTDNKKKYKTDGANHSKTKNDDNHKTENNDPGKTEDADLEKTEDTEHYKTEDVDPHNKEIKTLNQLIVVGRPKLKICSKYRNTTYVCGNSCGRLHICRLLLYGDCTTRYQKECCFSHSLHTDVNRKSLRLSLLHTFSIDLIKKMLKKLEFRNSTTLPLICWVYSEPSGCYREYCNYLHLCPNLLKGQTCPEETTCKYDHDLLVQKNECSLKKYGLWSVVDGLLYPVEDLLKVISKYYTEDKAYTGKPDLVDTDNNTNTSTRSVPVDMDDIATTGKWQLYIPNDDMWIDVADNCHEELERKREDLARAQTAYDQALVEMEQCEVSTLIGERMNIPEFSYKRLRRYVIPETSNVRPGNGDRDSQKRSLIKYLKSIRT